VMIKPEGVPFSFGDNYPKPKSGSMPMGELGKTGIKISKFGFGSHIQPYLRTYYKERERMVREAHELGVNIFDVYDTEGEAFQYEPMGKYLAPIKNDVNVSIAIQAYGGRTLEEEFERDMKLFGKDHIDLVRIHVYTKEDKGWQQWEQLFKWKEQGKIRAVGVPIHWVKDLYPLIDTYPIDYCIFPYNFFMNIAWDGHMVDKGYDNIPKILRNKGIGVITMKPFAGDFLATPLLNVANRLRSKKEKDVNFFHACLKYVINAGFKPDTTYTGMYFPSHVYENVDAYYNPKMTVEEKSLLDKVKEVAKTSAQAMLPEHYKFFSSWIPKDNANFENMI
jgi:predicted aldo/keto reductase-like oxidoreductase